MKSSCFIRNYYVSVLSNLSLCRLSKFSSFPSWIRLLSSWISNCSVKNYFSWSRRLVLLSWSVWAKHSLLNQWNKRSRQVAPHHRLQIWAMRCAMSFEFTPLRPTFFYFFLFNRDRKLSVSIAESCIDTFLLRETRSLGQSMSPAVIISVSGLTGFSHRCVSHCFGTPEQYRRP